MYPNNEQPLNIGMIPPQAIEMEEAVLGAILLDSEAATGVMGILKAEHFYKEANRIIFEAAATLSAKSCPVDTLTVSEQLRLTGKFDEIGGAIYLANITSLIVSTANSENHALVVKEKYILREYIRISSEIAGMVYGGTELSEVMDKAGAMLMAVTMDTDRKEAKQVGEIVDGVISHIEKIQNREICLTGVPSGFTDIDRGTGGWQPTDLIIIAARPSVGKTALALSMARNAATLGYPAGVFSLEMGVEAIGRRLISSETNMTNTQLLTGECLAASKLYEMTYKFVSMGLYIDDTPALTLTELKAKARKMIIRYGVKIFFIDYLQLMRGTKKEREQEVSELSRGLKAIAKELNVPIVALSQLNRKSEERANKKPMLSDLRDSGAIEQDADIVGLLSSPAKNGNRTVDTPHGEIDSTGILVVDIAKNRNGSTGDIVLRHNESMTIISDYGCGAINGGDVF